MRSVYVVVCTTADDATPIAVCDTEAEADAVIEDGYSEDYTEEYPEAGDRMLMPFEQFVREHPGRYKRYETVFISSEEAY